MKFFAALLAATALFITGCSQNHEKQVDALLADQPFHYAATITIGENHYPASLARGVTGDVTVTVLPEQWTQPLVFVATAQQSQLQSGDYTLTESVDESPAASIAVIVRQALLRLAIEPAQKENDSFLVKSGALSAKIDGNFTKIEQIQLPGITITMQ